MPFIKVPKGASKKEKNKIIGQNIEELINSGRTPKRAKQIAGAAGNVKRKRERRVQSTPKRGNVSRSKIRKAIKPVKRAKK